MPKLIATYKYESMPAEDRAKFEAALATLFDLESRGSISLMIDIRIKDGKRRDAGVRRKHPIYPQARRVLDWLVEQGPASHTVREIGDAVSFGDANVRSIMNLLKIQGYAQASDIPGTRLRSWRLTTMGLTGIPAGV